MVTGGVRCGKSSFAEQTIGAGPASYVTPGYPAEGGDPEWARRVARHRLRRPVSWTTVETVDVAAAIGACDGPVLVDCLGVWLTRTMDHLDAWEQPRLVWEPPLEAEIDRLVSAVADCQSDLVLVTNEVGWGVVPEHRSGRLFADWLGLTNQRVGAVCDRVVLMVAGRPLSV